MIRIFTSKQTWGGASVESVFTRCVFHPHYICLKERFYWSFVSVVLCWLQKIRKRRGYIGTCRSNSYILCLKVTSLPGTLLLFTSHYLVFEIFCKSQFTLNSLSFRLKRCPYQPYQVVCGTLDEKRFSQTSMQGGTYKMHFILYRDGKFCFFAVLTSQCFTLFFYCLDWRLCYRRDNETKNTETKTIVLSAISMKFRAFSSRACDFLLCRLQFCTFSTYVAKRVLHSIKLSDTHQSSNTIVQLCCR